jgi:hypothetical protein
MRDVLMDGLLDISCKWRIFFLYRSLFTFISCDLLRVLFLSVVCYGVQEFYIIINDLTAFLGYILPWGKCLTGQLRYY